MEQDILQAVGRISGRQSRECYHDLCCLIREAIPCMPGTFSLEELYPLVQAETGRGRKVLAKSLSRVSEDVWENGDREELRQLLHHMPRYKPAPKELIQALAMSVWQQRHRRGVCYRVLESEYPKRFGFSGESGGGEVCMVALPYTQDREAVEALVRQMNEEQTPIQEAQERLLRDAGLLPKP